jgi:glutathione reductase (NADPH)
MYQYDLIVIGGGSGGVATANRAASLGKKVALIEMDRLGGTCVNRGCVPKKVMWYAASVADTLHYMTEGYGFSVTHKGFSWPTLVEKREAYLQRLNALYAEKLDSNQVTLIQGQACFINSYTVEVKKQQYTAERILIAVGGQPVVPNIDGAELGISSDGFFELKQQPKKVCIIGSGYIGVEIAGVLNALGTEVTLVARGACILRHFERELSLQLMAQMQQDGVKFIVKQNVIKLEKVSDKLKVVCEPSPAKVVQAECCEHERTLSEGVVLSEFDCVIWAVGRKPSTENLALAAAGIHCDKRGFITVDKFQQTNVERVFAVGDVTPQLQLTPVAIAAGRRLARRLFGDEAGLHLDYTNIPSVVFSHPALASVGLTERQAIEQHSAANVKVYRSEFTPMLYAMTAHKVKTLMKIVTVGEAEKVVGIHMLGHDVDEILQGFAVAVKLGVTMQDLWDTVAIHPTSAEELVTM